MADTDEFTTLLHSISTTVFNLVSTTAGDVQDFGIYLGLWIPYLTLIPFLLPVLMAYQL